MKRFVIGMVVALASGSCLSQSTAIAPQALVIKPLAEKKVTELPAGPLVWRLENFPALTQAQAAAGPMRLVVQSGGRAWLFTLGPAGRASAGGTRVAEIDRSRRWMQCNISFGSMRQAVLRGAQRPCTRIRAPNRSTCSRGDKQPWSSWRDACPSR